MKSKFTKILCLVMGAILLITGTVAVTLAYLKAETELVENTMTVGKVVIDLDEADVDEDGKPILNASRVRENTYKLVPGNTYTKDPVITIEAGSENCWVFFGLHIDESVEGVLDNDEDVAIRAQLKDEGWQRLKNGTSVVSKEIDGVDYEIYCRAAVNMDDATGDVKIDTFKSFTVNATAALGGTANDGEGFIKAMAFAIQSANLDTAYAAWTAGWEQPNT